MPFANFKEGITMNISSIIVQTKPQFLIQVIEDLKNSKVCDYHLSDELGRIVVTIEGEAVDEELSKLKIIENIPHVISADMQMAYSEDELNEHLETLNNSNIVPKVLDDKTKVEDIVYSGDLKKKDLQSFAKNFH